MSVTTYVTTRKVGGSLVVTLPKEIVELENIKEKETIKIEVEKTRRDYFGCCKGIGRFTHKDRMDDRD